MLAEQVKPPYTSSSFSVEVNLLQTYSVRVIGTSSITGRGAKEANLYTEIAEGIHSYGVTRHRHGQYMI